MCNCMMHKKHLQEMGERVNVNDSINEETMKATAAQFCFMITLYGAIVFQAIQRSPIILCCVFVCWFYNCKKKNISDLYKLFSRGKKPVCGLKKLQALFSYHRRHMGPSKQCYFDSRSKESAWIKQALN